MSPAEIPAMLQFLDRPHSPDYLKAALEVLCVVCQPPLKTSTPSPVCCRSPSTLAPSLHPQPGAKSPLLCRSLLRARMWNHPTHLISFLLDLGCHATQAELATADKLVNG